MEKEQSRYSRLANITQIINAKLELQEVLQQVTTAISEEIVHCSAVGIYLPQGDGTYRGYAGKPELINGMNLQSQVIDPATDPLAAEVIRTRKAVYIPDTQQDGRPDPNSVENFRIRSLLALPISYKEELFGLVFLFNYGTPMNLRESEIESVEAYVNMAGTAIHNAKNIDEKEKLLKEKQLLLNLSQELSYCSTSRDSLVICFSYVQKTISLDRFVAHTVKPSMAGTDSGLRFIDAGNSTEEEWNETLHQAGLLESFENLLADVVSLRQRMHLKVSENKVLLLSPLISMGKVQGVVSAICSFGNKENFKEMQIPLAQSIIDATAPVFSNLLYMDGLEVMVEERTSALYAANKRVNSVVESITDGFFALNKKWEYVYINKHHIMPGGKKAADVLGKSMWEVFPEIVGTDVYDEFYRSMEERVTVRFEAQSEEDDYWYEVTAYPYDDGICCMLKNIKEKKKYEKELKRLANLDLIGQMAAGISHEIRNPMTTVRGFLQLLKADELLAPHAGHFDLMIGELDRANAIITEFLSVGNTRTSDMKMMNLNTIIQDIAPLIKIDAFNQSKQLEIYTQEIPDLLLNHNEIKQLIINLYRNGFEAMEEGGTLTIGTYMEDDNHVVLAVQDQGSGIDPAIMEKIGTPFYTTKEGGTGLGLGICYAVAARHNAEIDIETGPDGTIFFVKFKVDGID